MIEEIQQIHELQNVPWEKLERFGLEYREIAAKTKVSVDRILTLTNSIYRKTGTASKIELIDLFLKGN